MNASVPILNGAGPVEPAWCCWDDATRWWPADVERTSRQLRLTQPVLRVRADRGDAVDAFQTVLKKPDCTTLHLETAYVQRLLPLLMVLFYKENLSFYCGSHVVPLEAFSFLLETNYSVFDKRG